MKKRSWIIGTALVTVAGGAAVMWWSSHRSAVPAGFSSGNGRIEATEIDIATRIQGRIVEVAASEGESVEAGQILARMDTKVLEAQLREADAGVRRAQQASEAAAALMKQRAADCDLAEKELKRSEELFREGGISREKLDQGLTRLESARAACAEARAQFEREKAGINAAIAQTERLRADIEDSILKAPRRGRVLYRLAEPGEVLAAGGKVLTLIDLTDVYMTVFLPETAAGKVAIGAEARIVLDAAPHLVIPANVSFVSPRAQFTPKEVETRTEREKLMFRIKVQIAPELLKKHEPQVKTGLPGVAYVRLDARAEWPKNLEPRLPQ
jgi:HlyD family secretion protein